MIKKIISGIVIGLVLLLIFLVQGPILVKPRGMITEVEPTFVWIGNKGEGNLLVSEDIAFENALINVPITKNSFKSQELGFGEYYWKLVYIENNETFETRPVKFTINSFVAFSLSGNFIRNVGNVGSKLTGPTGFVVLEKNEEIELQKGDHNLELK